MPTDKGLETGRTKRSMFALSNWMSSIRLSFLLGALTLSAVLALLNAWALSEYLYWKFVWFDMPMHFLGGLALGIFVVGLLKSFRPRFFLVTVVVLVVGWEIFEYLLGYPRESNYVFDTSLDLFMDALGALSAYALARMTLWLS